jgi:hypothetical protein
MLHKRNRFARHYSKEVLAQTIGLCRMCHRGIHALYDEVVLAEHLNSLEKLQADPQIAKHCAWVAKQKQIFV